jgi:hypothetical protein
MAIPKALLQWATFCHLKDHKDAQLILLKGHLLLEIVMADVLNDETLSFYSKANKFRALYDSKYVADALLKLNRIRNELAHEWDFKVQDSGLIEWSDDILNNIEYEVVFRRTSRTKIVHAIAALAGEIYKHNIFVNSK